jgi:ATP-dependent DNA helicase RecG
MAAKPKFDPRKMMEKAIEVMRQSVNEPRADKKPSPIVGAVLVKPDGEVKTACRGELRHGDHAEYTLLERKHREERLDGSILFATLEPCAPGARKHLKMACAEHIVNARIAEVWVGIEDPDPTVDRQGIRYLEQHGIKVHLFDRDLQNHIREANKEFIEEAMTRAAQARDATVAKPALLSQWDQALPGLAVTDFAIDALARYGEQTKTEDKAGSESFNKLLERQGLLRRQGSKLIPTGFGFLLFGKKPREVLHHAGLNVTIEYPTGEHEIQNFAGPTILIPDELERWLRPKLPNVIDRNRMMHEARQEFPFELLREGVINALVHRDYDLIGATCHVVVTADTVTVRSPGAPIPPVTLKEMQEFKAPMYNRNPKLQFAFSGTKLVEGRGFGMKTFGEAASKYGLPLPKYAFDGVYLNLTIYRNKAAAVSSLSREILESLSRAERAGWEWLSTKESITSNEYAKARGVPNRTALNHLKRFTNAGLLEKIGSGPTTQYRVVRR